MSLGDDNIFFGYRQLKNILFRYLEVNMESDRLEIGSQILNNLKKDGADGVLKGLGKVAPELAENVLAFIFGRLYDSKLLDLKTKQIITITVLATLGYAKPQLAYHINIALNIGISREEIISIFTHICGYAGFPSGLNAVATAKEVFAERDKKNNENIE